jgi:hypothetical protein
MVSSKPGVLTEENSKMDELYLTALNGGSGDAFLLQDNGDNYLIDSGNRSDILPDIPKDNISKILFTADSDLSFCKGKKLCYANQIVVTAPHHGSNNKENERLYDIIDSSETIYLKSGVIKQVSSKFENLDKKVCNNCKQYNLGYQEAKLIHKDNAWIISSGYVCAKRSIP